MFIGIIHIYDMYINMHLSLNILYLLQIDDEFYSKDLCGGNIGRCVMCISDSERWLY